MHYVNEIKSNATVEDWYFIPRKLNIKNWCTCLLSFGSSMSTSNSLERPEVLPHSLKKEVV